MVRFFEAVCVCGLIAGLVLVSPWLLLAAVSFAGLWWADSR